MPELIEITIDATPTQSDFIASTARENLLVGPRGEGKTTAGVIAITHFAQQQPSECLPVPGVVVRDTFENFRRTTLKAIMLSPLRDIIRISEGEKKLEIQGLWTMDALGIDSLSDLTKLQGGNFAFQWFEECAPAAEEDIGDGIQDEAYNFGQTSLRYPCAFRRSQITENYPSEDHWTWERFVTNPIPNTAYFQIPRFENPHLPEGVRQEWEEQLVNRPDLQERLVFGRPGFVQIGQAVTPEFKSHLHVTREVLNPIKDKELMMGWDFGLFPTCVIAQPSPMGNLLILDSLVGPNMGMQRFIRTVVAPHLYEHYPWYPLTYSHIAGIEGNIRDQASETVAWDVIQDELPGPIAPNTQWPRSKDVVKEALCRHTGETMWIQISPRCRTLIQALRGGWHYGKNRKGEVLKHKPKKNAASHPADAFAGMVGIIGGIIKRDNKPRRRKQPKGNPVADL